MYLFFRNGEEKLLLFQILLHLLQYIPIYNLHALNIIVDTHIGTGMFVHIYVYCIYMCYIHFHLNNNL